LLAQAGLADCARASTSLERACADLPSENSFRDIDATLVYLHARLLEVVRPDTSASTPSPSVPHATSELPADSVAAPARDASDASDISDASEDATARSPGAGDTANVASVANTIVTGGATGAANVGDLDALDESQFSDKTRAIIRDFKSVTLRQRAPGEITPARQQPTREISDEIPEYLRRAFLHEATGDLADLRTLIASFSKMPGSLDDLRGMAQLGHKVKGTAATYLYPVLAEILHAFEGVPRVLQPVAISHSAACLNLLIRFADVIEAALHEAGEQGEASQERLAEAQALVAEGQVLAASHEAPEAPAASTIEVATATVDAISERATVQFPTAHRASVGDEDLLRVEPHQLDSLMHQADGLAMNRAMLAQTSEDIRHAQAEIDEVMTRLESLSAQLSDLHPLIRHVGDAMPGTNGLRWQEQRASSSDAWDDLEMDSFTTFDVTLRGLSEAVLDATTLSGALQGHLQRLIRASEAQRSVLNSMQQTVIHLRLVHLKALADRVVLAVHQVAQMVGKQVEVSITGQDTEIDRNISDALVGPILQLVRNAVAHGVEAPDERVAQGKPATGKVWFRASSSGNEVSIEVGDDGRGVNPHQLIAAAISAHIVEAKHADYLTREQALALMFEPNLSTSDQANVIAGHGIGLDSVLTAIQRLRGSISVRSDQGRGTVFQIRVPISLSITRALQVRVANNEYAIPISTIRHMFTVLESEILVSLPDSEPKTIAAHFPRRVRIARAAPQQSLRLPDDPGAAVYDEVPIFSLAELLNLEETPHIAHLALLIDVGQRQAAVLVDEVLDESEVVIRALPAHLRRRAVRGASIMSDGRLILVLDVAELLSDVLGGKATPRPQPRPVQPLPREHVPQVLVVDDSISMRRALEVMLTSVGYEVRVARDGVEALGMMITDLPDVMVLDIEMPRLDGFELLSVISGNEALAHVPVVILTSRAAEKHHRRAKALGARAYLTKPCPDEVLITTLQRVLREPDQVS
ncbi:MAG TPA: response regulator, partial [Ktedonobacterales bacterium]|nr:response regulator [Ktedonobacterales bacterium]